MSDYNYTYGVLSKVVRVMAVQEGDIKERWRKVFIDISVLNENDFPEELQSEFNSMKSKLTSKESRYNHIGYHEGDFEATIFGMHKKTLSKLAEKLIDIHDKLEDYINEKIYKIQA